jgi:hypothetical protein
MQPTHLLMHDEGRLVLSFLESGGDSKKVVPTDEETSMQARTQLLQHVSQIYTYYIYDMIYWLCIILLHSVLLLHIAHPFSLLQRAGRNTAKEVLKRQQGQGS